MIHEVWADGSSLDKRFQTPQMRDWASRRDAFLASREVTRWRRLEPRGIGLPTLAASSA